MNILVVRSVPLSKETRDAWKSVNGVSISKRSLGHTAFTQHVAQNGVTDILNLGNLEYPFGSVNARVWNTPTTISAVSLAHRLRKTLEGEGMPPHSSQGKHWHKVGGGFGGSGIQFHETSCGVNSYEVQAHIDGPEYRVITVGNKVVQAHKKENCVWNNGKHHFDWSWVGVTGIKDCGIIPLLKALVAKVPDGERSILGWDIILGSDSPYVIECNTSPGVNEATAKRVVNAVQLQVHG